MNAKLLQYSKSSIKSNSTINIDAKQRSAKICADMTEKTGYLAIRNVFPAILAHVKGRSTLRTA